MCILKIVTDLYTIKQGGKIKNIFCKYYLQCFSNGRISVEHQKGFKKINAKNTVKLRSG